MESYKLLQPDSGNATVLLLAQMLQQMNASISVPSVVNDLNQPPNTRLAVRLNSLWYSSLVCSLITASLAIVVKQWLREYLAQDWITPQERCRIRHYRYLGLVQWHVLDIAALLPFILKLALLLFFIGLSDFLWPLHPVVG